MNSSAGDLLMLGELRWGNTGKFRGAASGSVKNLVDICQRNFIGVTLVSRLARMMHHFFLDFIFH
jgi:hypothetical protein